MIGCPLASSLMRRPRPPPYWLLLREAACPKSRQQSPGRRKMRQPPSIRLERRRRAFGVPAPRRFEPDFQFELKIGTPSWMLSFFDWPSVIAVVSAVAESDRCRL